jgi:hypothetical protein
MLALLAAVVLQTAPPAPPPLSVVVESDVAPTLNVHLNRFW